MSSPSPFVPEPPSPSPSPTGGPRPTAEYPTLTDIVERCHRIYQTLGIAHNECVYQKALVIELYHMGALTVESEKNVPVFYTDSSGFQHTVGTERIDLFVRFPNHRQYVIELKATAQAIRHTVEVPQLKKYQYALAQMNIPCTQLAVINFRQQVTDVCEVDALLFDTLL